jgi:peptidyl-prolyl cis-trans isomerase B (cyclophilin B)
MRKTVFLILLVVVAGCADSPPTSVPPRVDEVQDRSVTQSPPEEPTVEQEAPMSIEQLQNTIVDLNTTKGTISIRFFPDAAPEHVRNFVTLARDGFYDGTKFHRVIPGFMIQGGDPNTRSGAPATWGTGGSGKNLKAEFHPKSHRRGIVSMARSGHPDSASSQFFIVVEDSTFLDNQYTVFGEVTSGMEVADQIVGAPRTAQDRPLEPVAIESVEIRSADDSA